MPISFLDVVEGDPMDPAALASNWALARTWLDEIPLADVSDGAIQREHLVRPVVEGFPIEGGYSTVQAAYGYSRGIGQPAALAQTEWGPRRTRIPWLPFVTDGLTNGQLWRTPIGRGGIYLPRTSTVRILMTADCQVRGPTTVLYPDGASGAGTAGGGYLAFHSWDRTNRVETEVSSSRRDLYPVEVSSLHSDKLTMCMRDTFSAGTWDFMLVYHRASAPSTLAQIDLDRVMLSLEVR